MHTLLITSALLALGGAAPELVHLETKPALATDLERALSLRGISTTTDARAASWLVRVTDPGTADDPVLLVEIRRPDQPASSVRLVAGPQVATSTLVRNLALIIAQHTMASANTSALDSQGTPISPTEDSVPAPAPAPLQTRAPTPPPAPTATVAPPTAAAPTVARQVTPGHSRSSGFFLRVDLETSYFDQQTLRIGPMIGVGYRFGRLAVELAASYQQGLQVSSSNAGLVEPFGAYVDHVTPGTGFISRLALTYTLVRLRSLALRVGLAGEIDYNTPLIVTDYALDVQTYAGISPNIVPWIGLELGSSRLRPTLRFGWRQPIGLGQHDVDLYTSQYSGWYSPDPEGMFITSLGVAFNL